MTSPDHRFPATRRKKQKLITSELPNAYQNILQEGSKRKTKTLLFFHNPSAKTLSPWYATNPPCLPLNTLYASVCLWNKRTQSPPLSLPFTQRSADQPSPSPFFTHASASRTGLVNKGSTRKLTGGGADAVSQPDLRRPVTVSLHSSSLSGSSLFYIFKSSPQTNLYQ